MLGEPGVGRSQGGNFRHSDPGQVLRVPVNRFAHTSVRLSVSNLGCLRLFPMVEHVTTLAGVHAVLPPHRYTQAELTAAFTEMCLGPDGNQALLERLHANAQLGGLRPDVKRMPLFGLGCVAGAAGIARLHDYLIGHPDQVGALISVELCSLTVQRDDHSVANLVASGLFGDGAAAVVAVGANRQAEGPRVLDSRSHLYPDSEQIMGWDVGAGGLKIVLDAQVPAIVQQYLGQDIRSFLAAHSLQVDDVGAWVSHPAGPKVIEAIEAELGLAGDPLERTWRSLDQIGNLSSSSVLHVLRDTLAKRSVMPGTPGMLMAMGPGFCSELVLLQW